MIRNNPEEWRNCLDLMVRDHGLPQTFRQRLLQGSFSSQDSEWASQFEKFMNARRPTAMRTLEAVAELRHALASTDVQMVQTIWLRTRNVGGGEKAQLAARRYGAEIVTVAARVVTYGNPNTNTTSADFGRITGAGNARSGGRRAPDVFKWSAPIAGFNEPRIFRSEDEFASSSSVLLLLKHSHVIHLLALSIRASSGDSPCLSVF